MRIAAPVGLVTLVAAACGTVAQFDEENKNFGGQLHRLSTLDPAVLKKKVDRALARGNATVIHIRAKKGAGGGYARAPGGGLAAAASVTRDDDLPVERGEAARPVAVPERSTALADARRFTLDNGLKVVLLPTESALPVVTAKLIFGVGEAHDPADRLGLARLAVEELSDPVASKAEGAWIYSFSGFGLVGIHLYREVGPDTTVFTARGLAIHQDFLVKGLERMIKENRYSRESVEREQQVFELQQRRRAVQSERAVARALAEGVFGAAHPYAVTAVATTATRKKIGVDDLHGHARGHFSAANATLILAGAFDAARAEQAIRDNFGGWSGGRADPRIAAPAAPKKKGQVIGVVGEPSPLLRVYVAYPAPMGIDSSYAARRVLVEMLGRRPASVRERLGASYGVHASYEPRSGPSLIEIGGAVDAERGGEALATIRQAIEELRRGDGFLEDFVRARRAVLEETVINANDSLSLATRLELIARFGLPATFFDEHVATLAALTPQHVLALAKRELDPALQVLVVEGERAPMEAAFAGAKITSDRIVEAAR